MIVGRAKDMMPSGRVFTSSERSIRLARKYSFQVFSPLKTTWIMMPGRVRGTTILRKLWKRLHPSMMAASSRLAGSPI